MSLDDFNGNHVSVNFAAPSFRDVLVLKDHFFSDFQDLRELTPNSFCADSNDGKTTVFFSISIAPASERLSGLHFNFITLSTTEGIKLLEERRVTPESIKLVLDDHYAIYPVFTVTARANAHSPLVAEAIGRRFCPSRFKFVECNDHFDASHGEYVLYTPEKPDERLRIVFSNGWIMLSAPATGEIGRDLCHLSSGQLKDIAKQDARRLRSRVSMERLRRSSVLDLRAPRPELRQFSLNR